MAQLQIDLWKEAYQCDFDSLHTNLLKREACCTIDENHRVVVKKRGKQTYIQLVSGGKKLKIDENLWSKLCNLKESVLFLYSFINDH